MGYTISILCGFFFFPIYSKPNPINRKPTFRKPWENDYPQDEYFTLHELERIMKSRKFSLELDNDMQEKGHNDLLQFSVHKVVKHKSHDTNFFSMLSGIIHKLRSRRNSERKNGMDKPLAMWNCWFQKLISEKYEFSPSCNPDGGFQTKQCFLSRCWCAYSNIFHKEWDATKIFHNRSGTNPLC